MKDTLVAKVVEHHRGDYLTLECAAATLTAPAIAARTEKLNRRAEVTAKTFRYLRWLVPAGVVLAFNLLRDTPLNPLPELADAPAIVLAVVDMVVAVVGMVLMAVLEDVVAQFWTSPRELELLAPISGTHHCEDALKALENGGPLVTQWRDLAIAERSQLHVFDTLIMSTLCEIHRFEQRKATSEIAEAERQARLDAVCRKVHGIDDIVTG